MTTTKPVSAKVQIDASAFDTNRVLFFDRYDVHHGDRFVEMHFGFYGRYRELQSGLIVVMTRQYLEEQRETFLDYLKQMGGIPESVELQPCVIRGESEVVAADIMNMARHGEA